MSLLEKRDFASVVLSASIPWLCRHGWHFWQKKSGIRHFYVECRRCHKREIWLDHVCHGGYQPIDSTWGPVREK